MATKNRFELDPERLATTDEHGNRVYLYPEDYPGKWKTRRNYVYWGLIFLYLVFPWIYINGKPALQLNLSLREFTFLGHTLYGVEPVLIFLLLASALFFVAFMTSLFGRVWCGWGCPQTVFIHSIFLKIETLIEGKSRARLALDQAPWNFKKVFKRTSKWTLFTLISLHIAHTFIGYFVGPRELFEMTMGAPSQHFGVFMTTMILTAILLFDFGWFREQFCIIACPYGRIQSVMMDENSKIVAYDYNRPDCVNCYQCVKVCPTGIDIRRGTQLECIACTLCIDACDDIMDRVKKPQGLIRYTTEVELKNQKPKRTLRPYLYAAVSVTLLLTFGYLLSNLNTPKMVFLRPQGAPFLAAESSITNRFTLKITHQSADSYQLNLVLADDRAGAISLQTSQQPIELDGPEKKLYVFFKFNPDILEAGIATVTVNLIDLRTNHITTSKEVTLVGPME